LDTLEETLDALTAGGYAPGEDVYDHFAQAIKQLKGGDRVSGKLLDPVRGR
jgi:hypothetical protein